ncbi:MAG: 8-oxo-dGTP diphosphatase [Ruminococcaceae bacterium]|nr:8-oxo-dGTP diphosphatase [Oscillospiraceae bacterium]
MKQSEQVTFTNMCMITDENGRVLVQKRVDPKWPGLTFPGGHVERGESFTEAVKREVLEETGLTVSHLTLCGIKDYAWPDGRRYAVLLYKTDRFSGVLRSSSEGEVSFADLSSIPSDQWAEGMEQTLRVFLEEKLSEQYAHKEHEGGDWIEALL